MAFSPDIIDQVRNASDIVQVVGERVPLKKAGASYKGLCPFHNEKSPSFNVVPSKQIFHCFGCGEGGDVFAFISKIDKVNFAEALKILAGRAGIELPEPVRDEEQRRADEQRKKEEEEQVRLLELAAAWFRRNLEEGTEGKTALAYAEGRGLDAEARERFQLGYAPADGRTLVSAAQKKGFSEAALLSAGVAIRNERGFYARFRGRLMFPIHDPKGRLCGFGGRILGPGEPKYLNSPEGPLFNKSKLLYPWPQAKDALGKTRTALVCEGYMDAIACHQAGLQNAVASLGTALTDEHAKLLKRYVDKVCLIFDADAAGLRAARRAGEPLLGAGLDVRVVRLQGAKDPDELLRREGPAALQAAVDAAQPLLDFCAQAGLQAAGPAPTPHQRAAILADSFPLLARLGSAAETDAALKAVAAAVGVSDEAANSDFQAFKRGELRKAVASPQPPVGSQEADDRRLPAASSPKPPEALVLVERELLALLVAHPELVEEAKLDLEGAELCQPALQAAAQLLWKAPRGVVMLVEDDGSEEYKAGDHLLAELSQRRLPQLASPAETLFELTKRRTEVLLDWKRQSTKLALQQEQDPAKATALLAELQQLQQAIQETRKERHNRGLARTEENA
jgi:DNA primase